MIRVYVAGPISKGDMMDNIRNAIKAGDELMDAGFVAFVPHVTCFWNIITFHPYEQWCKWDDEWLKLCHAVLRLPGESKGADAECELALKNGIPVFTTFPQLIAWSKSRA